MIVYETGIYLDDKFMPTDKKNATYHQDYKMVDGRLQEILTELPIPGPQLEPESDSDDPPEPKSA